VIVLISRTLPFRLNVTLTSVFNFTVLLSYRAIHVFNFTLTSVFNGHEPSRLLNPEMIPVMYSRARPSLHRVGHGPGKDESGKQPQAASPLAASSVLRYPFTFSYTKYKILYIHVYTYTVFAEPFVPCSFTPALSSC